MSNLPSSLYRGHHPEINEALLVKGLSNSSLCNLFCSNSAGSCMGSIWRPVAKKEQGRGLHLYWFILRSIKSREFGRGNLCLYTRSAWTFIAHWSGESIHCNNKKEEMAVSVVLQICHPLICPPVWPFQTSASVLFKTHKSQSRLGRLASNCD